MKRILLALLLGTALLTGACNKAKLMAPDALEASSATLVEDGDNGTTTLLVDENGMFNALLKDLNGKALTGNITGNVTFKGTTDSKVVPVKVDTKTGVVGAAGGKLEADLTSVEYDLMADGKPFKGVVHVPPGGTVELRDTANVQVSGKTGPNGGIVQVVGPDHIEIVADKTSGEVRAYVLDANLKPIEPGDRKITIALDDEGHDIIVLTPEPQKHYVVAKVVLKNDPARVTIVVTNGGVRHACIVGYSPGTHLVIGTKAPRVKIFVFVHDKHWHEHDDEGENGRVKIDIKDHKNGVKVHIH